MMDFTLAFQVSTARCYWLLILEIHDLESNMPTNFCVTLWHLLGSGLLLVVEQQELEDKFAQLYKS